MLVVQVNVLQAEPAQRRVAGCEHVVGPPVDPARLGIVGVADDPELGGENHLVTAIGDRAADQQLIGVRAIDVRRVEEIDAEVERVVDGGDRLALIGRAVELRHAHGAQPFGRDRQSLCSQRAMFHDRPA
jgi:hypothetical protein